MPFDFAVKHGAYLNTFLAKKRSLQSTIYLPIPCVVAFWFWFLTCVTTNSFFYRLIFFTSRTNGELKGYLELKAFFNYAKETMGIEKLCKKPDKDKPTFWLFIRMIFFLCRQNINKKIKLVGWHGFTMNCCFSPQVVIPFILSMSNNLLGSTVKRYFHSFLLKCFMTESQCPPPLKTSRPSCQTRSKSLWQNTLNYIFHYSI